MPSDVDTWYARQVFFVIDCDASLRFYAGLGFVEDWRHEEDGSLVAVQVSRSDWGMPVKAVSDPDANDLLLVDDDLLQA